MRGQTSFEFFVVFSFLILLFMASLTIYDEERKSADVLLSAMNAQSVASDFSRTINGVYQCGSGCSYTLLLRDGYSLRIHGRVIEAFGDSQLGQAPLSTDAVELGSATPGRYIHIENKNGVIELHDV